MWRNTLYLIVTVMASFVRGERQKVSPECLLKKNCEPATENYICSEKITLNECQQNYTIKLDPERDVVIYRRNVSDGRLNSCKRTRSDCKVTQVVDVDVIEENLVGDTCNDKEVCTLKIRTKPKVTACNGEYFAELSYECIIAPGLTTSDPQHDGRNNSAVVAGILAPVTVLILVIIVVCLYKLRRRKYPTAHHLSTTEETATKERPSIEIIKASAPHLNETEAGYVLPWQGGAQCPRQHMSPDIPVYEDPRNLSPKSPASHPQGLISLQSRARGNCCEGSVGEAPEEDTDLYDEGAVQILTENELYGSG